MKIRIKNPYIGVPITYIGCHCPEQFEIIGITDRSNSSGLRTRIYTIKDDLKYNDLNRATAIKINGILHGLYARILIRRK